MENIQSIILICLLSTLIILLIRAYSRIRRIKKDRNHQKALVYVLRHRLGDKPDNSKPFSENELKEINCWSGRLLHDIYLIEHYNRNSNSPIVDNTVEPPKGTVSPGQQIEEDYKPTDELDTSNPPIAYNMNTKKKRNTK